MNKFSKNLCLALGLSIAITGCVACGDSGSAGGGDNSSSSEKPTNSTISGTFNYEKEMLSTMEDPTTGYNNKLFYVNNLEFEIADPSVIYIDEGEEAGWFYAYGTSDEIGCHGFQAWRSKDLSHWECTGIAFNPDHSVAWASRNYWAPEVIYDRADKVYYMFYNAQNMNKVKNGEQLQCLSVAYSRNPQGPFVSPDGRKDADGNILSASKPVFDLTTDNPKIAALEAQNPGLARMQAIDACPFIDPETGDKYLYFSYYDTFNSANAASSIFGMKMKNWFTPDYSTLKRLTYTWYSSVAAGQAGDRNQWRSEGGVNEGPYMVAKDGKYYLTLSIFGYTDPNYRVIQAIADSPLGDFVKVSPDDGGVIVSTDTVNWNHIVSAGHHSFVKCGDEMYIAYHTFKNRDSIAEGRALAMDKIVWTTNSEGTPVMHTNGPTWSVQPLPESLSGYKNIALSADITSDNTASGSDVALLNDGLIKYQDGDIAREYETKPGTTTIKLNWAEDKTVRSILVYNSCWYENTFVRVEKVTMEVKNANGGYEKVVINNLEYDWSWHFEPDYEFIRPGGAAIAEFDELPVKSIELVIKSPDKNVGVALGEIVVLGKDEACAPVTEFKPYSYSHEQFASSHIVNVSKTFGTVEGTNLQTTYGYDLSHDDGTENAYITQSGVTDQFAYFNDIYSESFYVEAEFTVTGSKSFMKDGYPKFGIVVSCDDKYTNTLFYYVDAVNYTNKVVGCAQRKLDNTDWDWTATEQLVNVDTINYTNSNYVKLAILRKGRSFYLICNDKTTIVYDSFNIFDDYQKAAVGFLSFNTPMKIKNYYASDDQAVIDQMASKYAITISGETFGKGGNYSSTAGWDFSHDNGAEPWCENTEGGDQYAFFRGINSTKFTVETQITVTKDMGDPYPKFGLAAKVGNNTFFFYIDGSGRYTTQRVGYVSRNAANDDWAWGNSVEKNISLGKYTNDNYVTLKMERDGNTFKLYANGELIFTVSDVAGFGENDDCSVAVLTFTTGVKIKNYSANLN